jgi:hypothetical protein
MRLIETAPAHLLWESRCARENGVDRLCAMIFLFTAVSIGGAQSSPGQAKLPDPPSEVVQRMVRQNAIRSENLKYFTSLRHYHLDFHGLGRSLTADMHAKVTYSAGAGKTFQVIDQSGSRVLLNHVLLKLLETEEEDSRQQNTALTPSNYDFVFETEASENGRPVYEFSVAPKVDNKLLYRGKIWIDARDYAVIRVEAQPAENPSFWIRSTEIHHSYVKIGDFWLPQTNTSVSKVRFGGTAILTIDYGTYQFDEPHA